VVLSNFQEDRDPRSGEISKTKSGFRIFSTFLGYAGWFLGFPGWFGRFWAEIGGLERV
jgi:hypothetical protein